MTLTPCRRGLQELASANEPRQGMKLWGNRPGRAMRPHRLQSPSIIVRPSQSATQAGAERRNDRVAPGPVKNASRAENPPVNAHFTRITRAVEPRCSAENDCWLGLIYSNCMALFAGYDRLGMDAQQSL
jgi:hypothetical protein